MVHSSKTPRRGHALIYPRVNSLHWRYSGFRGEQQKAKTKPDSPLRPLLFPNQLLRERDRHRSLLFQTSNPQPYRSKKPMSTRRGKRTRPRERKTITLLRTRAPFGGDQQLLGLRSLSPLSQFGWRRSRAQALAAHNTSRILP